jgi:hypothetical protein
MPKKKLIPIEAPKRSINSFMKIDPRDYTPADSPADSPATTALVELQDYAKDARNFFTPPHASMSIAYFLKVTWAINVLLTEHIIGGSLAHYFASLVSRRYHMQGRS